MKKLLIIVTLLLATAAHADERILSFDSMIDVFADGAMQVTETITVQAEGKQIKRGIYRDFPTDYRDRLGNRYRVDFEVVSVRRDGVAEPFHTAGQGNGIRVYIGNKNVYLSTGTYRYELTYRTNRQLGFFDDHDELYWNVTGNDWAFPIDAVTASVRLPADFRPDELSAEGYTGPRGAQGQDYRVESDYGGITRFVSTRPFGKGEGLTIVLTWPKGFVTAPTTEQEVAYVLRDNRIWLFAIGGLGIILAYYLFAWLRVGRDPDEGVIIAQYSPPIGFSPASTRFIERMGYDHKSFAAAVINLAVKGLLEVIDEDGKYVLKRTQQEAAELAPGEKALLKGLFGNLNHSAGKRQALEQRYHAKIRKALKAHEESLRNDYEKRFFVTNKWWIVPGLVLSVLAFAVSLLTIGDPERMATGGFLMLWLTGWSVGVALLAYRTLNAWRGARTAGTVFGALFITAFSIPFVGAEIFALGALAKEVSPALPTLLVACIGLNLLFYQLLKAPTRAGRRLLDKIEGFRLFLEVAEKDEMNFRNPPEKTPELFEKYLPYALALDVEQPWSERFARLFGDIEGSGGTYHPAWYHGHHWGLHHPSAFATSLGSSLSSALASSSTAPGSSYGSGGGGFSGGGGGGGGGGGW